MDINIPWAKDGSKKTVKERSSDGKSSTINFDEGEHSGSDHEDF